MAFKIDLLKIQVIKHQIWDPYNHNIPPCLVPSGTRALNDNAVLMQLGLTTKTLTPWSATSALRESKNACMANLDAVSER